MKSFDAVSETVSDDDDELINVRRAEDDITPDDEKVFFYDVTPDDEKVFLWRHTWWRKGIFMTSHLRRNFSFVAHHL